MNVFTLVRRGSFLLATLAWLTAGNLAAGVTNEIRILQLQGTLEITRHGAVTGVKTTDTNQPALQPHDRLRTGPNSRVTLLWSDQSPVTFGELTELEILPAEENVAEPGLHLMRGVLSFFHRDKPGRIRIITRGATAGIEGTEFVMAVTDATTTLSVLEGRVMFTNAAGALMLTNGQQAVVEPGACPRRTAGFNAENILQWCLYYPAVLDVAELSFSDDENVALAESLSAYRAGDLLAALERFPAGQVAESGTVQLYHAALLLSVGKADAVETRLQSLAAETSGKLSPPTRALQMLIAAVKRQAVATDPAPQTASELLAASYLKQSEAVRENSLAAALQLARQSVERSPGFGFGWSRVAELEFSFGRIDQAAAAVDQSLQLSPRNAEALALKGFLLAAQNRSREARGWFDRALEIDPALGNAWLGRGLCRMRLGETQGGRRDLLTAAALEPRRAALRSYLGKAWSVANNDALARKEFTLARQLDPDDPTPWLYSALNHEEHHRVNQAVRDLEHAQDLNDNRRVYRSGLLLDQDRAVRSVNLAKIYDEAGLGDVAVREAGRAVAADYANYSAHLFLANSFELQRGANLFDLRYETPAFGEYLLASLLGPADGRLLAQPVTQQEYTRLFERDSLGASSSTEYLSRGAWKQYAAQYGTFRDSSYALESAYQWDPGQTPNGSFEAWQLSFKFKQMLTPKDGLFFQVLDARRYAGDISQRYDPAQAALGFKFQDQQEPGMLAGWHHQWGENQHTLVLAGRFDDSLRFSDPHGSTFLLSQDNGRLLDFQATDLLQSYANRLTVSSLELQHIIGGETFQTIAGARVQYGDYSIKSAQAWQFGNANDIFFDLNPGGVTPVSYQLAGAHSFRVSPYLYEHWRINDRLWLLGGMALDYQSRPRNPLFAPVNAGRDLQRQFSPKLGVIWTPTLHTAVRAAYTKSLGGASLDQSLRLEPTQFAGFVQAYRSLIPDSVGGADGASMETGDVSLEHRFATGTYVALSAQWLQSKADQAVGAFLHDFNAQGPTLSVNQRMHYRENSEELSVRQLLGDWFSMGARYRVSDARLSVGYPEVSALPGAAASASSGLLHLISLDLSFRHPSGVFAGVQGNWWAQELHEDLSSLPGDRFWQANLMVGYRSPKRRLEISAGLLNVTDQDYRLHPINLYPDLARRRTFVTRLQLNF